MPGKADALWADLCASEDQEKAKAKAKKVVVRSEKDCLSKKVQCGRQMAPTNTAAATAAATIATTATTATSATTTAAAATAITATTTATAAAAAATAAGSDQRY